MFTFIIAIPLNLHFSRGISTKIGPYPFEIPLGRFHSTMVANAYRKCVDFDTEFLSLQFLSYPGDQTVIIRATI